MVNFKVLDELLEFWGADQCVRGVIPPIECVQWPDLSAVQLTSSEPIGPIQTVSWMRGITGMSARMKLWKTKIHSKFQVDFSHKIHKDSEVDRSEVLSKTKTIFNELFKENVDVAEHWGFACERIH